MHSTSAKINLTVTLSSNPTPISKKLKVMCTLQKINSKPCSIVLTITQSTAHWITQIANELFMAHTGKKIKMISSGVKWSLL